jgi:hydrogenase maturation protease
MPANTAPLLVAAFGNEMAADDAFGPLVVRTLRTMALAGVEVIDLGMKPAALLDCLAGRTAVCIVDAAMDEDSPAGRLIETDFFDSHRPQLAHDRVLSSHGLSIAAQLELASGLGMLPDTIHLVAVIVGSTELGQPVTPAVKYQVPVAAKRVARWASGWDVMRR